MEGIKSVSCVLFDRRNVAQRDILAKIFEVLRELFAVFGEDGRRKTIWRQFVVRGGPRLGEPALKLDVFRLHALELVPTKTKTLVPRKRLRVHVFRHPLNLSVVQSGAKRDWRVRLL